jgi:hypothetical protein
MRFPSVSSLLASLCLVVASASLAAQQPKMVAAPPQDIEAGVVRLPSPASLVTRSRVALLPVDFPAAGEEVGFQVPVSRPGTLTLVPLAPVADRWELSVTSPSGRRETVSALLADGRASARWGELSPGLGGQRLDLPVGEAGAWTVTLASPVAMEGQDGWLLVADDGPWRLASHLTTHRLHNEERVGVVAWVHRGDDRPSTGPLQMALTAETPLGPVRVALHDDGRHQDGVAGDGVYGGDLPPLPPGRVTARVVADGLGADGTGPLLTTSHAFPVLDRAAVLSGEVQTEVLDELRLALDVGAWFYVEPGKLHVSAEVWGRDASGVMAPACWLSTMVSPADAGGSGSFRLVLDGRWLGLAGIASDLELREVRVADPDTHLLHDHVPRIALGDVPLPPSALTAVTAIAPQMLTGVPAAAGVSGILDAERTLNQPTFQPLARALLLSHGYCSGGNIWPDGDFSEPKVEFFDPDQNRSHDEFAQLFIAAADAAGKDTFGVVGHSQGGNAALHLFTYYTSGLDGAVGNRRIQAVATPWAGTPLAAELANLGAIFGAGCGENFDLSESGAALWLSGIPSWARVEVWFWTTQNSGSACNSLTNFFLDSPNDGVVEMAKGVLAGGNNEGHVSGWCHTTGMSNPASYTDSSRNVVMDAEAAR